MTQRINLYANKRDAASTEAKAQNIRQDNTTKRGNQILSPINPYNQPTRDNYQTYPYDYYSGADCKIFFGDIWVDDIMSIQYNVSQQKTPIYGYASQLYDAVARGQVIVQGSLAIAFKETGYLNIIHTLLERQKTNNKNSSKIEQALNKYSLRAKEGIAEFIPGMDINAGGDKDGIVYSTNGTPQLIRQSQTIESILNNKIINKELSSAYLGGDNHKNRDFEDFAELLEDSIWGDSNGNPLESKLNSKLKRPDEFDHKSNGGIEIGRRLGPDKWSYSNCLNILLTFGDINDFRAEHTIVSLNDVHFQSQGVIVTSDGTPIAEQYTFFAREINSEIGETKTYNINPIKLNTGLSDVEISKLENIDAINDQLTREEFPQFINIVAKAALPRGGKWLPLTGNDAFSIRMDNYDITDSELANLNTNTATAQGKLETRATKRREIDLNEAQNKEKHTKLSAFGFTFNGHEPLVDQIIKFVEREFNEFGSNQVKVSNAQYIVDVEFRTEPNGSVENKLTMVLDQSIPESRTYRVISPTRQNFGAANILNREDLFRSIDPVGEIEAEKRILRDDLTDSHRRYNDEAAEKRDNLEQITSAQVSEYSKKIKAVEQTKLNLEKRLDDTTSLREKRQLESRLSSLDDRIETYNANINELTDDTFNGEDSRLLKRKDKAIFMANVDDYDRAKEQSEYYKTQAARINVNDNQVKQVKDAESQEGTAMFKMSPLSLANKEIQQMHKEIVDSKPSFKLPSTDGKTNELKINIQDASALEIKDSELKYIDPKKATNEQYREQLTHAGVVIKNDSVNFKNINPKLGSSFDTIKSVFSAYNDEMLITSANDSTEHHRWSLHYKGEAIDIRTKSLQKARQLAIVKQLKVKLGKTFDVVLEDDHIHIEYDPR